MKKMILLALVAVLGLTVNAQTSKPTSTVQKVVIQTNGVCSKCEALFNEHVPFFKGVKDYTYDSKTSKMTVMFDSKKTNAQAIRQQISKLGYNADDVKADPAAREKLPACCKVEKKAAPSGCSGNHKGCSHQNSGCGGH